MRSMARWTRSRPVGSSAMRAAARPRSSASRVVDRCSAAATSNWARDGKWCSSRPRETPARACTASVDAPAYPSSTRQATAASRISRRLSAVRSERVRLPADNDGHRDERRAASGPSEQSSLTVTGDRCHAAAIPHAEERRRVDFDDTPTRPSTGRRCGPARPARRGAGAPGLRRGARRGDTRRSSARPSGCSPTPAWSASPGRASTAGRAARWCSRPSSTRSWPAPGCPTLINHIGLGMCGPTVIAHGSDGPAASATSPGCCAPRTSGASCSASRRPAPTWPRCAPPPSGDGDEWVVNGQKVWTTLAHVADYGILLTRTDPDRPKHDGLTDVHRRHARARASRCGRCAR